MKKVTKTPRQSTRDRRTQKPPAPTKAILLPIRNRLQSFLDMMLQASPGATELKVLRLNDTPKENSRVSTKRIDRVDKERIRSILAALDTLETMVANLTKKVTTERDGKAALRICTQARAMDPRLPLPSSEEEAIVLSEKQVEFLLFAACSEARQQMAYSEFINYTSEPLVLEGLTVRLANVMIHEAEKIGATTAAKAWRGLLGTPADLDFVFSYHLKSATFDKNGLNFSYEHPISDEKKFEFMSLFVDFQNADFFLPMFGAFLAIVSAWLELKPQPFDKEPHTPDMGKYAGLIRRIGDIRSSMLLRAYNEPIKAGGGCREGASKGGTNRRKFDPKHLRDLVTKELAARCTTTGCPRGALTKAREAVAKKEHCSFHTVESAIRKRKK